MRLQNAPKASGSFSSPEKLAEEFAEQRKKKVREEEAKESTDKVVQDLKEESTEEWPLNEDAPIPEPDLEPAPDGTKRGFSKKPIEILRDMGIEPQEEDFHDLIFRGYIEKEVEILKNPVTKKPFKVEIKALTAEEVDMVDELLMEEVGGMRITTEGMEARRSTWILSVAIQKISGRNIVKEANHSDEKGVVNKKSLAKAKRSVILKLNPFILSKIVSAHANMVASYNSILNEDTEDDILKK